MGYDAAIFATGERRMSFRKLFQIVLLVPFLLSSTAKAEQPSPAELVRTAVDRVLATMQDSKLDRDTRRNMLRDTIEKRFDLQGMSRSVLAAHWEEATPEQQTDFVALFGKLLEDTYISAIESYTSETVRVGGERIKPNGDATVIVTIVRPNGTDIPLLFKLHNTSEGWIAYDANIEGISLVSHYRNRFAGIVRSDGMEGLLQQLENWPVASKQQSKA
jgi:phospholipid transport system substrate-binding protein